MAGLQDWASWILADRNGQLGGNKSAALAELKKRASDVGQTFSQYIEPTLTIASGMAGSAVGGIVGMAGLPFGVDAASSAIQRTQDWMTYKPRTESGQKGLQWVGEKAEQISAPVNKAIGQTVASITNQLPGLDTYGQQIQQTIADKGPTQALGDYVTDTTGSPFLGTAAKLAPDIIDTVFGLKGLKAVTKGLPQYEIGDISGQAFGQKGIFGGIRAKNADLPAQAKAEQMLNSGASRDEVWAETGWFKDVDDSWKFEIDDSTSSINMMGFPDDGGQPIEGVLSGALNHPRTYMAYPEAKDIAIMTKSEIGDGTGSLLGGMDGFMSVRGGPDNFKSTTLHETQHAIQQREGFAEGGSTSALAALFREQRNNAYIQLPSILEDLKGKEGMLSFINSLPDSNPTKSKRLADYTSEIKDLNNIKDDLIFKRDREISKEAVSQYRNLAGEAEARNVETRMDWTPEQRKKTPPWVTRELDVPENELIVRGTQK